jgi:hypothetical protein
MIRKNLSVFILTMMLANSVFANAEPPQNATVKKNVINPIKKIIVYGDVDVILLSGIEKDVTVNGNNKVVEKVKLVYQHENLEVVAPLFLNNNNRPVVRIPANNLTQLEINGNGRIYSETLLNNTVLNVYINGLCDVHLRSHGKINVYASPEFELKFKRNETGKFQNSIK